MQPKDFLDILALACAIAVAVTVGRTNIKKQTIADQTALILIHEQTISAQAERIRELEDKIENMEETIDGYAELVRQGYISGGSGQGSRNRPAASKTTKNRTS